MWTIDKLQVLRRDKQKFQVCLMNKDLKILPKERKEEIVTAKSYLEILNGQTTMSLIIDKSLPERLSSTSSFSSSIIESAAASAVREDEEQRHSKELDEDVAGEIEIEEDVSAL